MSHPFHPESWTVIREVHCDPTASHYLKTLLDAILGAGNFRRLLVQVERVLRINELAGLSEDVVEAARETLIIGDN